MPSASDETASEPIDPDVDLTVSAQRGELASGKFSLVVAVALGGALGAAARYGLSLMWPTRPGEFPWSTWATNVVGCALIGVFMAWHSQARGVPRLARPFVGTGLVATFTGFTAQAFEAAESLRTDRGELSVIYPALTLLTALAAVWLAATITRALLRRRRFGEPS